MTQDIAGLCERLLKTAEIKRDYAGPMEKGFHKSELIAQADAEIEAASTIERLQAELTLMAAAKAQANAAINIATDLEEQLTASQDRVAKLEEAIRLFLENQAGPLDQDPSQFLRNALEQKS